MQKITKKATDNWRKLNDKYSVKTVLEYAVCVCVCVLVKLN